MQIRQSIAFLGWACATVCFPGIASPVYGLDASTPSAKVEAARLNNIGSAMMNQQLGEKALQKFTDAYSSDPTLTLARANEGVALIYLQRLPEAETALLDASQKAPSDPHSWYSLALVYRSENKREDALAAAQKVATLDPNDADTHYLLGSIEMDVGDLAASVAEFRRALAINPKHASAQFGLARALQRQGKAEEAHVALASFQHITAAKLGAPVSHVYGEEGKYARVEDASVVAASAPMIPVHFTESWRSKSSSSPTKSSSANNNANICAITLHDGALPALVVMAGADSPVRLYQANAKGQLNELSAAEAGLHLPAAGTACAVGDYDSDGLPDLALATADRAFLFRNIGNDKFEDVSDASGLNDPKVLRNRPTGLLFVDYDHDGDVDLFVTGAPDSSIAGSAANLLWRNNGNKTFTEWSEQAGLRGAFTTTTATLSDLNNDRAVDLITIGAAASPIWYANQREGAFVPNALFDTKLPSTVSVATLDFDKDGWMDVAVTHVGAPGLTLWRNIEGHGFARVPLPLEDALSSTGVTAVDFDNDGWLDLAVLVETVTGPQLRVLRNLGAKGFADVTSQLAFDKVKLVAPRQLLALDVDRDGASDLIVTQADGSTVLLRNDGGARNHSLRIGLKGLADNKTGVGAKVEVFGNGLWQKWENTGQPELLAGLGGAPNADLVRILWPTGVPQDELDLDARLPHLITELDRRGSSCPTLFAWNGDHYSFVTDVIGAGVIGHWVSPSARNIPDPDEWIKIDGSQLKQRNGLFSLRFGEPMEEVNFVDQVRLVAVDHPLGSAAYPNEGFLSSPPFAQAKTVIVSNARRLRGAWDDRGVDVLPLLSRKISQPNEVPIYVRDFTNLAYAGFANEHALTLDLGPQKYPSSRQHPLRLLLHGFVEYFSASSMYSAWQAGLTPHPPSVEALYPDGQWHQIIEDMGFPAGLPRTVVVDLTGKLPTGVSRIRIRTNLQIYWDHALLDNSPDDSTVAPEMLHQTDLPIRKADLEFRGYPKQVDGNTSGDLTYDYQKMSQTGPFVPHRGGYTRYGEITPLLSAIDDKFVIFGTGEDMDLEFSASTLPPLPSGWTRDFFFYANGFVKDMDFYEASPFQVGSLPFHGMTGYPYPATEHYPDDAAHTAYQLEYNTRFESGAVAKVYQFDYRPRISAPDSVANQPDSADLKAERVRGQIP